MKTFEARYTPGTVVKFKMEGIAGRPQKAIVTHVVFDGTHVGYSVAWFVHGARHAAAVSELEIEETEE